MKRMNKRILNITILIAVTIVVSIVSVYAERMISSSIVSYNNTTSNLSSTNVQGAVDELYARQKVKIDSLQKKYYGLISKNPENIPLVDYIRGMLKDDGASILQDDGTKGHNMRYIGSDPNNWISFNGELWKIIGVFGTDSHGQTEELIKIQYSNSAGAIKWDDNNTNDWAKATLKTYLNEGTYYNTTLNTDAKSMIQTVDWKLGAAPWEQATMYADVFYNYERGSIGAGSNPTLTEWNGNVALAYPSDIIFSTNGGATHSREECLAVPVRNTDNKVNDLWGWNQKSDVGECAAGAWMLQQARNIQANLWTITPQKNSSYNVYGQFYGNPSFTTNLANANNTASGYKAVPTVYLKSNVICTNCGDNDVGTESNPYQIELK